MKLWSVRPPQGESSFITFQEWEERQARQWMRDHDHWIQNPSSILFGATLELVEFESEHERIQREHAVFKAALELIKTNAASHYETGGRWYYATANHALLHEAKP